MSKEYLLKRDNKESGPFSADEMKGKILSKDTQVFSNETGWKSASDFSEFNSQIADSEKKKSAPWYANPRNYVIAAGLAASAGGVNMYSKQEQEKVRTNGIEVRIDALDLQIKAADLSVKDFDDQISLLEDKKSNSSKKGASADPEITMLDQKIQELRTLIANEEDDMFPAKNKITGWKNEKSDLEAQMTILIKNSKSAGIEIEDFDRKINRLLTEKKESEKELTDLKSQKEALEKQLEGLKK